MDGYQNLKCEAGGSKIGLTYRGQDPEIRATLGQKQSLLGPEDGRETVPVTPPPFANGSAVPETQEAKLNRFLGQLERDGNQDYYVRAFVDEFLKIEDEGLMQKMLEKIIELCKGNITLLNKVNDYGDELNRNNKNVTSVSQQNGFKLGLAMYETERPWITQ